MGLGDCKSTSYEEDVENVDAKKICSAKILVKRNVKNKMQLIILSLENAAFSFTVLGKIYTLN